MTGVQTCALPIWRQYAGQVQQRFDNLADLNTSKDDGKTIVSIFSSLKRAFPMQIDMMEKHPLGSQAFIPMKETTFLCFVAPPGESPDISKIQSFIVPPKNGINYKPGIWHFPLISTENTNFLVIDRKGKGENLIIHKFKKDLFNIRFKKINGQLENTAEFLKIRKNIARLYSNIGSKK